MECSAFLLYGVGTSPSERAPGAPKRAGIGHVTDVGSFFVTIQAVLFPPRHFPVFDWQNAGALFEQLCKAAGGGVATHLGDLTHGKIGVD